MNGNGGKKQEKTRHLHLVRIERTPLELAELELKELVYRQHTAARPRRFYKVVADELFPLRLIERLTDDAIRAGCSEQDWTHGLTLIVGNLARRKFRKARPKAHDTGEFRPAA